MSLLASGSPRSHSATPLRRREQAQLAFPLFLFLIALIVLTRSTLAHAGDDDASIEWFEKKIRPVLVKHCYECHSQSSKTVGGNLRLDFREGILKGGESGPAVIDGKPDSSLLLLALRYDGLEMPPSEKLPESVISEFKKWIQLGLPDPRVRPETDPDDSKEISTIAGKELWSLQPVVKPVVPQTGSGWAETPIDHFIAARQKMNGLTPVADASPRELLRRVYFDLTGLPPTYAELEHFEHHFSMELYVNVVDQLLASPRFGERWGRHWLDVARFAESNGNDRNVIFPHAWRYRDYVIQSFNADKPFDQFVREQIAGDLMPSTSWQQRDEQFIATGFLTLGSKILGEGDKDLFEMNVIDEQIDVVTRSLLGLTVGCARCHDHKFDPVPTRDYYALAGIFGSTESLYGPMTNANPFGFDRPLQPIGEHGAELDGPAQQYRTKVAEVTGERNKARSTRYGFVRRKAALENEQKKTQDAVRLAEITAELKTQDDGIAEWDRKIEALDADLKKLTDNPPEFPDYCMAVRDLDKPADFAIRIRGEAKQKGDVVPRGVPMLFAFSAKTAVETSDEINEQSGRLLLADWLVDDANPLTVRVAVNRIWQHLFGRGLVDTPDNFGHMGERPSHPKLLDWLATRFRDNGWSIKQTIREIILSRTYRLSSKHSPTNAEIDPANSLLWRSSVKRLDAESLRDAMLFVAGELDLSPADGSVISTFEDREFNSTVFPSAEQLSSMRRSVYLPVARYWVPNVLAEFDFADPSLVVGKRTERTMVSQSLFLMNSSFIANRAKNIAAEVVSRPETDRAKVAFSRILLRDPTETEAAGLTTLVRELANDLATENAEGKVAVAASENAAPPAVTEFSHKAVAEAWTTACQTLLMTAEFRYLP
ncbi:MAG: DUF1553 domain-containing protein [Rhodopirellula sp.]|nr:DUF1553 domain-containing protein [Rhodopirellula sp.]